MKIKAVFSLSRWPDKRVKIRKVLTSPQRRNEAVVHVRQVLGVSEREACRAIGVNRAAYRKPKKVSSNEAALTADIIRLASQYGQYGYKKVTALLRVEGWRVNHKRVERIWRAEGLRVPERMKKRGRLYLNDSSCIRLRACWKNHVWAYDFVFARLLDGTKIRFSPSSTNTRGSASRCAWATDSNPTT